MQTLLDNYDASKTLSKQLAPIITNLDFSSIKDLDTESLLTVGIGLTVALFYGIKVILKHRKTKKEAEKAAAEKADQNQFKELHVYVNVNVTQNNTYNTYSYDVRDHEVDTEKTDGQPTFKPRKQIV